MSRTGAARVCALLALGALVGACSSGHDQTTTTTTTSAGGTSTTTIAAAGTTTTAGGPSIELTYANGSVVGGAHTEKVPLGSKVRLVVTSDVADEVHVHTYDLMADVGAGQTVTLVVDATIPGRHEVELEKAGKPLVILEVK